MMKKLTTLAVVFFPFSTVALAATSPCVEKAQNITREIHSAEQHHNSHRVAGLKKALQDVQAHCDDEKTVSGQRKAIAEKREDVKEQQKQLAEARAKGDAQKTAKRERRLTEAQRKLKALETHHD